LKRRKTRIFFCIAWCVWQNPWRKTPIFFCVAYVWQLYPSCETILFPKEIRDDVTLHLVWQTWVRNKNKNPPVVFSRLLVWQMRNKKLTIRFFSFLRVWRMRNNSSRLRNWWRSLVYDMRNKELRLRNFFELQNFGHKKTPDFSGVGFLILYYVPRTI